MKRLTPLSVPQASGRVVATAELRRHGVAPWRLYAGDISHPVRGVVAAQGVDPSSFDTLVAAARVLMMPGHFLSRRTAARVLELPVRRHRLIEVGSVHPAKPRRRREFAGHQVRAGVLREVPRAPLWTPHPADTWGLLAPVCGLDELIIAGDFLISGKSRRAAAVCTLEELADTVRRSRGSRRAALLRAALPLLRTGVESPAETSTRLLIVRAGFPEPVICCPVPTNERTYYADLGYPELKIAIEYDGAYHFGEGVERARRDNERIEAMLGAGWRVLRLTALDLRDPRRFLRRLADAIEQRESERRRR